MRIIFLGTVQCCFLQAASSSSLYSNSSHILWRTPNGSFNATGMEMRDKSLPIFFFKMPHNEGTSFALGAGIGSWLRRPSRIGSIKSPFPSLLLLDSELVTATARSAIYQNAKTQQIKKQTYKNTNQQMITNLKLHFTSRTTQHKHWKSHYITKIDNNYFFAKSHAF